MEIRPETTDDAAAISVVIAEAFALAEHADGTEAAIVERLRIAGALTLSLVAIEDEIVIGHVALSPIAIDGEAGRWLGVGPLAVRPDQQRRGIGGKLMREALHRAQAGGAAGCVLVGEPAYYSRFGFAADPRLRYSGPPPQYFQALSFDGKMPSGEVTYHPAFGS